MNSVSFLLLGGRNTAQAPSICHNLATMWRYNGLSKVTGGAGIGRIVAMLRTTNIIAAAAVMSWASVASAEEHTILVLQNAFFPDVIYVKAGDSVRFVNEQAGSPSIISKDEEWEIGPLGAEGSNLLPVSGGMETVFYVADETGVSSVSGALSFEPAPAD